MTADACGLAALEYARRGWPVLPVFHVVDGICSCPQPSCKSPGKHPMTPQGLKDATSDLNIVEAWWRLEPYANVAIRTGPESGITVLDVDPRHDGNQSLVELCAEYGELPSTVEAHTGGGGRHFFFNSADFEVRNRNGLKPGLDVRGKGGYVVAPPSFHVSGHPYRWRDGYAPSETEFAVLPVWLFELIMDAKRSPRAKTKVKTTCRDGVEALVRLTTQYLKKVEGVREGSRNDKAFSLAGHLAAFTLEGSGKRLSEAQIIDLMQPWNHRNQPPLSSEELAKTVWSAMNNGTPRAPKPVRARTARPILQTTESNLPEVALPRGEVRVTDSATTLGQLMAKTGEFFTRGNVVVTLSTEDKEAPELSPLSAAALPAALEKVARVCVLTLEKGQPVMRPAICSEGVARLILNSAPFVAQLPPIRVMSACPVLIERDGHLIQLTEYDRETGILAAGKPAADMDLSEAKRRLDELIFDFRFATVGDRARALAAVISAAMVLGGLISGRVPVDLGEADKSQAGKGFRNKVTAAVYNDRVTTVTQRKGGVGSLEERFDSCVIGGCTFLSLDNVRGRLDSPAIESFLTEDSYVARAAYSSNSPIDPRRVVVMMTSNRAEITPDLANRSSCVRILKQLNEYVFASYPEGDILDHVRANNERFLGAVFAVIRAWYKEGRPLTAERRHSYRGWSQALDWIVQKLLEACPLLDGHGEAQQRMSTPALSFLRDVVLAVKRSGRVNVWLRTYE